MRNFPLTLGAAGLLLLAGCAGASPAPDRLEVATGLYPLQFVAEAVAGGHADVIALAAPGVEPHDIELSPASVRALADADLVLHIRDFQPAVDAAIDSTGVHSLDAADVVDLHDAHHAHEGDDHADEDEAEDEHDHGATDPHFWLDPTLLAAYAQAVVADLSELDPSNAADFERNGEALVEELADLDQTFTQGLATCERREIVTAHEAFGYLAEAYSLEQFGISGIDPEAEPSPARIREIADIVAETDATTIFAESAVNTNVVDALARDAGVAIDVLSPIETVTEGDDYISVMERNLAALRSALDCE